MKSISIAEVAERLGVSVPTVRRLLKLRELGFTRIGRRVTIPAAEVERYAAERFTAPEAQ